jgi:hypothetical protein
MRAERCYFIIVFRRLINCSGLAIETCLTALSSVTSVVVRGKWDVWFWGALGPVRGASATELRTAAFPFRCEVRPAGLAAP